MDQRALSVDQHQARALERFAHDVAPLKELSALELKLTACLDQLTELLTISGELAKLHNQTHEMMRASSAERSALLDALYASSAPQG